MSDGSIDIEVKLNSSQAQQQANKLGNQLGSQISKNVDSAVKNTGKSTQQAISEIGTGMAAFGASYSKAVTLPIAAAAVASGAAAVKVDTALTGVRKTVDATEEEYQRLKQAAIEFSQTNPVDPATILDIQALGAQLGYLPAELQGFSETIAKLGASTNMTFEEAATELAQFSNIMGMAHDDTERYGSTIVALGNSFATTESDISHMAMRIAGAGKQIGLSEADVLGLATALSSMGIEAEAGGTAISTIMSQIDKDVALGTDNLKTWADTANMSVDEFTQAWGTNAVEALSAVLVGMDNATQSGGNMAVMLDELGITSIRQTDVLKRLASNSGFLGDAVHTANKAWEENIALDKEVENRNNSMAAKLQILWNKIQAVAIEVGEPLMDALLDVIDAGEPLVQMLADGAKAFADMSKDEQQMVLKTVAVVAAIGPVTSGIGKLLTSVTSGATAWKSFANNLSVVKNNLTRSATSTAAASASWGKYFQVVKNGEPTIYKVDRTTGTYTQTNSKLGRALATTTVGVKAQDAALKLSNATMRIGSTVAKTLGAAMKTIAPIAVISAAVAIFSKLSDSISSAKQHTEDYQKATKGLEDAATGLTVSIGAEGDAFSSLADSIEQIDFDEVLQKHKELANTLSETAQNAANSQGMLSQYGSAISDLAGRADLSEPEIARLRIAVDGVNDACGTSYEVAQDANGAWQVMGDGAVVAKDKVLQLIEAQKQQIRFDAEKEQLAAVYKQLTEDNANLAKASKNVAEKQEAYNKALAAMNASGADAFLDGTARAASDAEIALKEAQQGLSDITDQMGSTQSAANRLEEQQTLTNMAMQEGASAFVQAADGNLQYKAGVQSLGVNLVEFTQYLEQAGFSVEEMSNLTVEQAQAMAQGWQGGTDQLIAACEQLGIEVPEQLRAMGEQAAQEATTAGTNTGQGFTSGLSAETQSAIAAALEIAGLTIAEFDAMAEQAGVEGDEAALAFAEALANGEVPAAEGAGQMVEGATNSAEEALAARNDTATSGGEGYGDAMVAGMRDSIANGGGEVAGAVDSMTAQAAANAEGAAAQFQAAGSTIPTSMASGISASGGAVGSAAAGIVQTAVGQMNAGTGQATSAGTQTGSGYSSGISGTSGKATASGNTLTKNATNALNQGVNQSRQIGTKTGEAYVNGMKTANARAAGSQLAQQAVAGLNEGSSGAYNSGANLGQGFINGMASKMSGVIAQARSLAQAAVNEIKRVGQEGSPWKTTIRSGQFAAEGLAIGMNNREQMVVQQGREMVRSTLDAMRDEVANDKGVVFEFDEKGQAFAKGIIVGFETIDPMSQINSSIMNGVSALTIATQSAGVTNGNSYNTNNQTINFNSPVSSPDEIARTMRMQQHYGLAGRY